VTAPPTVRCGARSATTRPARARSPLSSRSTPEHLIDTALGLLAVCLLIVANGVFVAAEFALVAVDRSRVDRDAEAGSRRARLVRSLLRRLSFHLAGAQLGITVTSLIVGFLAEPVIGQLLEPLLEPIVGERAVRGVSLAIAFALATIAQMIVAELVPKGLAIARPDRMSRLLAPFIAVYGTVFGPVIHVLNGAANWTVRRLGMEPREELSEVRTLSELERVIAASTEEGTLAAPASTLLTRSIRFGAKTAADALVPRPDVVAIGMDASAADLVQLSASTGYSRFPVSGADIDDVRGTVLVRTVHGVPYAQRADTSVATLMEDPVVVPETRELEDVLLDMQQSRQHLMVVVDEYGGTAGIVTLEDIVEEIVGEIDDEYDARTPTLTKPIRAGRHALAGGLHADEVREACGFEMPEGDYETLAGFVLDRLGHIPAVGERVEHDGWVFEVLAMDRHRIAEVGVREPAA
jgi:CBS domain containing-hemolysin-like protein